MLGAAGVQHHLQLRGLRRQRGEGALVLDFLDVGPGAGIHGGKIVATGESYKDKIKVTFHRGAALDDVTGLFNSSLDGGTRRAVDFFEGDEVPADAFTALYAQACDQARSGSK